MKREELVNHLSDLGFTIVTSDQPLDVSLTDVTYPLAIITVDYQSITENSITTHYMVSVYWPKQDNFFLASTTGQSISSYFNTDVNVSPLRNRKPDISGGLMSFDLVDVKHNC